MKNKLLEIILFVLLILGVTGCNKEVVYGDRA